MAVRNSQKTLAIEVVREDIPEDRDSSFVIIEDSLAADKPGIICRKGIYPMYNNVVCCYHRYT